jgi:hypothetical protein
MGLELSQHRRLLFVSGQVPERADGSLPEGFEAQCEQAWANVLAVLQSAGPVRGAIRRGRWKLVKWAPLPGRIELYDMVADPGERSNLAGQHPELVRDLEVRLLDYARRMKPAEWTRAQPQFIGPQGHVPLVADRGR